MSRAFGYEPEPNERAIHRRVNAEIFRRIFKDGLTADEANLAVARENGFDVVEDKPNDNAPTTDQHRRATLSELADLIVEGSNGKIDRATPSSG